jgi:hypothetical protein
MSITCSRVTVKIAWEREETAFIEVDPTLLHTVPLQTGAREQGQEKSVGPENLLSMMFRNHAVCLETMPPVKATVPPVEARRKKPNRW